MSEVETELQCAPVLRWAGGKRRMLADYDPYFPKRFKHYHEPFLGGGAVYCHLYNRMNSCSKPSEEVCWNLGDANQELISLYDAILYRHYELRGILDSFVFLQGKSLEERKTFYYNLRAQPSPHFELGTTFLAARTIYLNKNGFNGMFRENSKGDFNVPFDGSQKTPRAMPSSEALQILSRALQSSRLHWEDFRAGLRRVLKAVESNPEESADHFVYLDPPYVPIKPGGFVGYTSGKFSLEDHQDLAQMAAQLSELGVKLMLSNSDCEEVRDLYAGLELVPMQSSRSINCKGSGRGKVSELLLLSKSLASST